MSQRASVTVTIVNRLGLHARPAMSFVDTASEYKSAVRVRREDGDHVVDGKSIMEMMMLAATQGVRLVVEAEGEDAEAACAAIETLVADGFDDD